jgi:hypothetical protein
MDNTFIYDSLEYSLLFISITSGKKNNNIYDILDNNIETYFNMCTHYNKYQIGCLNKNESNNLLKKIYDIINIAIQYKMICVIINLQKYVDYTLFYKDTVDKKKYKKICGNKLLDFIEIKDVNKLIK